MKWKDDIAIELQPMPQKSYLVHNQHVLADNENKKSNQHLRELHHGWRGQEKQKNKLPFLDHKT